MAKTKRKRQLEARDKKEARKILRVVAIATAILLILVYFMFRGT